MSFEQMNMVIPVFRHIRIASGPERILPEPDCEKLIIVRQGYLLITAEAGASGPVSQGYACHSAAGIVDVQLPAGRAAEYAILTYSILPEQAAWEWNGPQRLLSEHKVYYMVDALLLAQEKAGRLSGEAKEAHCFRNRMMLERILSFYMYETRLSEDRPSTDLQIEQSIQYIEDHYMLKLTLPLLSKRAGLSIGHYSVRFKKRTGQTFSSYLKLLRIEKAKLLLAKNELTAKEAAHSVGFGDYFHFSRTFKELTGLSPTEYRQQLRETEWFTIE